MLDWNEQQTETLKTMWEEGASATEIACALGPDASRNAVIGKVHRLKLPARLPRKAVTAIKPIEGKRSGTGNPGQPNAAGIRARRSTQAFPRSLKSKPLPAPFEGEPDEGNDVTYLLGLNEHTCRWPVGGEGSQTRFCGKHSKPGKSYCEEHGARSVYRPA